MEENIEVNINDKKEAKGIFFWPDDRVYEDDWKKQTARMYISAKMNI